MKKSLLAVAAIGAFASAAQAQSSVTVYGILDMGYAGANSTQSTGTAVTKTTSSALIAGSESTSRLGFKGVEDLGGGTKAFFTVEMKVEPDNSSAISVSGSGNRQTFVGLSQKGIGAFSLGTQYTPIHEAVGKTDPGQQNNVAGNLIYSGGVGAASLSKLSATGSGTYAGQSYTIRQANSLVLKSDNIAGFTARAMLTQNNKDATQTSATGGGNTNASGWGLGIDYAWKKLYLTANYQSFTARNTSSASTAANLVLFGAAQANTAGTNVNDNQQYYAATYDFGILKAYAQAVSRSSTQNNNSAYYQKYSAQQIGVRSFITPKIEGWASASMGKFENLGASIPKNNLNAWQLGSNYWLSKRTNLYAIYGMTATSNAAVSTAANAAQASYNQSNYAVGVRHTF
jgi:predicted porin